MCRFCPGHAEIAASSFGLLSYLGAVLNSKTALFSGVFDRGSSCSGCASPHPRSSRLSCRDWLVTLGQGRSGGWKFRIYTLMYINGSIMRIYLIENLRHARHRCPHAHVQPGVDAPAAPVRSWLVAIASVPEPVFESAAAVRSSPVCVRSWLAAKALAVVEVLSSAVSARSAAVAMASASITAAPRA